MNIHQMKDRLNELLPLALDNVKDQGYINMFEYMISDEKYVNQNEEEGTDTIISICLSQNYYSDQDNDIALVLTGIDEMGTTEFLGIAEASETGLENLFELFNEIVNSGGYDKDFNIRNFLSLIA